MERIEPTAKDLAARLVHRGTRFLHVCPVILRNEARGARESRVRQSKPREQIGVLLVI